MENPSMALKVFVYVGWLASVLSMLLAFGTRGNQRFVRFLESIPLSPWTFSTIVLSVGTYLLVLSQEMSSIVKYNGHVPIIDSVLVTIRMFGAQGGSSVQSNVLAQYLPNDVLCNTYDITNSLARLAAPIDTLMGIYIFVTGLLSSPRLRFTSRGRDTFVFSNLNDMSLALASSITEHYEHERHLDESEQCLIAFTSIPSNQVSPAKGGGQNSNLLEKAVSREMLFLAQPIIKVIDYLSETNRRRVFVISGENEMANLQSGLSFVKKLADNSVGGTEKKQRHLARSQVYVMSSSVTADIFIDDMAAAAASKVAPGDLPPVSIRRIDRLRSTIESFLWKYPLFLVEKPSSSRVPERDDLLYTKHKRRIAIIGAGTIGCEFLKAAVWCSQMDDIDYTIDVISTDGSIKERLRMDCPEILRLNGNDADSAYHINFVSVNVERGEYLDYLHENRDELTYLIIALGDDLTNIKAARRTREILEQGRFEADKAPDRVDRPLICAIISDKSLAHATGKLATGKGEPYDILPIGIESDTYSYENLLMPHLDLMGQNVNRAYWGCYDLGDPDSKEAQQLRSQADAGYNRYEYNRRSSRATAIHLKYNLFAYLRRCALYGPTDVELPQVLTSQWRGELVSFALDNGAPGANMRKTALSALVDQFQDYVDNASPDELRWLSKMEHDRWNAYIRTEGYELADEQTFHAFYEATHENQNRLSRQHVCLVPFEDLQATSDFVYPVTNKATDKEYERLDDVIVHHLKQIVEDRHRS